MPHNKNSTKDNIPSSQWFQNLKIKNPKWSKSCKKDQNLMEGNVWNYFPKPEKSVCTQQTR